VVKVKIILKKMRRSDIRGRGVVPGWLLVGEWRQQVKAVDVFGREKRTGETEK